MRETTPEEMLTADAIATAITTTKDNIKLKRMLTYSLVLNVALCIVVLILA